MIRATWTWILLFFTVGTGVAADLSFYLGDTSDYDAKVPKPADVLGFEVGAWHVRHDLLVAYMRAVAEASDRVELQVIGYTHEHRPLLHLTFSSPENMARIEAIREAHLALADPSKDAVEITDQPVVINMGYSVHGNEPSGANASLLVAYYLAASPAAAEQLKNAVIIMDPSLNPDGLSRFAQWANMHKSKRPNPDPAHREHNEGWPSGRTNHYWFDLNRDWLPLVHPESRARIQQFHRWRPNILTDHHEMGTNSTFFFQPGIPTRTNPLTPEENQALTRLIATYHAKIFNQSGVLYYSEQSFDDFYYGKGSTYPDIQGTIGILFEQASSRGHAQERSLGILTFPQTILNQVRTSMSTLEAGLAERKNLLSYQRDFFRNSMAQAKRDNVRAYVFGDSNDPVRTYLLADVLNRHGIEMYRQGKRVEKDGVIVEGGYVVPTDQAQYRLLKTLFQEVTEFRDNTFYDVSTWNFGHAWGLPFVAMEGKSLPGEIAAERVESLPFPSQDFAATGDPYAYVFSWKHIFAPRAAYRLLDAGIRLRFANGSFTAVTRAGERRFEEGAVMIPRGYQDVSPEKIKLVLQTIAKEDGVDIHVIEDGLTPEGIDLGSPSFDAMEKPVILLMAGQGTSSYEVGEMWHMLDARYGLDVTVHDQASEGLPDVNRYTHIIMVNGRYNSISDSAVDRLKLWVREGGVLLTTKGAVEWAANKEFFKAEFKSNRPDDEQAEDPERLAYSDRGRQWALRGINGSIFRGTADRSHPLAYGLGTDQVVLFRNSTRFMKPLNNPYANVVVYNDDPLISGYVSKENLEAIKGTTAVAALGMGRGAVIAMVDNPNFRGFWFASNRLVLNALFFGRRL